MAGNSRSGRQVNRGQVAVLAALLLGVTMAAPVWADQIILGSATGGGLPNMLAFDPNLKAVEGPQDSDFTDPDFAAAVATLNAGGGAPPFIVFNSAWLPPIAGTAYVNSRPGGAGQGFTGAYLATFTLPDFTTASLDLDFLADNLLNDFLLNGNPVATPNGGFGAVTHVDVDNSTLFVEGLNRLIFRFVDVGGPAGYDFKATVDFTPAPVRPPVPVPPSLGLVIAGLGMAGAVAWRRRSR